MKIKESFNFIHESEGFLRRQFNISQWHLNHALEGIYVTINWLKSSIFHGSVRDLTFFISDEPINFPGELALDDGETFLPVIYLNVMSITENFQNGEYRLDMKKNKTTSFEYASFVLLHEVGHYVHALIGGQGINKKERIFDYFDRGEYHYERFVERMGNGETHEEKKRYRNIPHEKAADRFARHYVKHIIKEM